MRFDSKWQVVFTSMPSFAILGIIVDTISVTEARPILTTTDKINKRIDAAVNGERNYWQKKVDENEKKIKNLNNDLLKAQEVSKKLTSEKSSYEQKAKADLDRLTKEKDEAVSDLDKTKSEFENTKKNLNASIENLKKEIEQKTKEQENLNKKITDTEKAKKEAENKAKKTLNNTIKKYNSRIKKLNKNIIQKSNQLKAKTLQLKNLNLSFDVQSTNLYNAEAKTYNDIEILKGTIRTLQSELKALVTQGKFISLDSMQRIKVIKDQIATEKQNFAEQIKAIQEADVQNLLRIEKLNNLIQRLIAKNQKLEIAGKILEKRLMAKIHALKKRQQQNAMQYKLLTEAYAKAESQNLVAIDHLKQELSSAVMKNRSLLKLANHLHKVRRAEDIADSKMETNLLLKIENLKNELNAAAQKNEILVKNIEITKKYIDNLKKAELNNSAKLQNEIQSLTTEIKTADDKYKALLQKYNNRENWAIEKLDIKASAEPAKNFSSLKARNTQVDNYAQSKRQNPEENGTAPSDRILGYSSQSISANNEPLRQSEIKLMDDRECQQAVKNMENKYTKLLQDYDHQEKWIIENLNRKYVQATNEHQVPSYYQENNTQRHYYHDLTPHMGESSRAEAPASYRPPEGNSQTYYQPTAGSRNYYQPNANQHSVENKMPSIADSKNAQNYYGEIAPMNKLYNNRERWKLENLAKEYAPSYSGPVKDGYQPKSSQPEGLYRDNVGQGGDYRRASLQAGIPASYAPRINEYGGNEAQGRDVRKSYTERDIPRWFQYPHQFASQDNVRSDVHTINNSGSGQECQERLKSIENKYNLLLSQYNNRGQWIRAQLDGKYTAYRDGSYNQAIAPEYSPNEYYRIGWNKGNAGQSGTLLRNDAQLANYSERAPYPFDTSNQTINDKRNTVMPAQSQGEVLNEDELVKFALETTLKAVEKMANYDKDKIQASLKLIGAEAEMPKKLSAIVDVIKDRYNPAIYQKVVKEIAKMYS